MVCHSTHEESLNMRIGDLVRYYGSWNDIGIVLKVNDAGGTILVHRRAEGDKKWWVTSGCEVLKSGI
tara:strand:+ start:2258 stop:2458 length:201 start_codon:yes stop_codon:yes gene_type:complete